MSKAVVLERLPRLPGGVFQDHRTYQRKRVYIFLTRNGLTFSLMLVVMLLGAVNYNNSMAYILTFLLASLFMICILHTYRNLSGMVIRLQEARPVYAGDHACFPLLIENHDHQIRLAIQLESAPKRHRKKTYPWVRSQPLTMNLSNTGIQQEHIYFPTRHRGLFTPGRVKLSSRYPLGLFVAWSYFEIDSICIVYPQPAGDKRLPFQSDYQGQDQVGNHAGTDDFSGYRPYQNRDPVRTVDWKKYAAEQGLLSKRFSGSGSSKLLFRWQATHNEADTEAQLSQLCLWIIEAEKHHVFYGLELPGRHLDISLGPSHKEQCLSALSSYGNTE